MLSSESFLPEQTIGEFNLRNPPRIHRCSPKESFLITLAIVTADCPLNSVANHRTQNIHRIQLNIQWTEYIQKTQHYIQHQVGSTSILINALQKERCNALPIENRSKVLFGFKFIFFSGCFHFSRTAGIWASTSKRINQASLSDLFSYGELWATFIFQLP